MFGRSFQLQKAFGKLKARSQMCLLGTDDGRILEVEINVLKGCAAHDPWCSAWLLDAENQMQDEKMGQWFQILGERSTIPICLVTEAKTKDNGLKQLINSIFHESWVMDLVRANMEAAKQKTQNILVVLLGSTMLLGALILGIQVITNRGG